MQYCQYELRTVNKSMYSVHVYERERLQRTNAFACVSYKAVDNCKIYIYQKYHFHQSNFLYFNQIN